MTFGGEKALDGVDLAVWPSEVLGLLGANGSGKSTLAKVLAGFHQPAAGRAEIDGREAPLPLAGTEARQLGLRFVHQDLGLIPSLTVIENLMVGEIAAHTGLKIDWHDARRDARRLFERYELEVDPGSVVADLPPVKRAMLAIARATKDFGNASCPTDAGGHGVLVLDEPTVFLSHDERKLLFDLVRRLAARGVAVIFVSHDLEDVREVCHRVVVLRDGRVAGDAVLTEIHDEDVIELIVGRAIGTFERQSRSRDEIAPAVSVSGLSGAGLSDVSFSAGRGEILGLTGLSGSGFEAIPYLLYGAERASSGRLTFDGGGHPAQDVTPDAAMSWGFALVPADRAGDGVVGELPVEDNISLPVLRRFQVGAFLRPGRMRAACASLLARFGVKPPDPRVAMSELSGGNQQRAVLAKWLQLDPRVLLLHEPTQGVDISARQDIYRLVRAAANDGMTVICSSSDHEQLEALCDRALVFRDGRVVAELRGESVRRDELSAACVAVPGQLAREGK